MVTENVNIRFVESGARVVKRKIDEIGEAANNATRGLFLLKRALFVIGGAGLVSTLASYADALTNMENRLRLTSSSTQNLEAVQDALFASANRSRSAVEATGEIYTRVALSARNLGASQQDVISVTETLQKAAVISGASAREANAALIQLGQGLASNRLSGDELRSVLEQLPYVSDLIVDYLNKTGQFGKVSRGELRQLGKEGKLTAQIVFDAIKNSQQQVDALFAQTNPTIEQAFNVARNNILKFIDDFDDATGASALFARAIITLSEHIGTLVNLLSVLAGVAVAVFSARAINSALEFANTLTKSGEAVARYFSIQTASARSSVAAAEATAIDTRAKLENILVRQTAIRTTLANAQAEYAEATASFQNGRARDLQTGRFIANEAARDRLTAATIRLTAAERAEAIAAGRVTALRGELALAENAQAAATTRLATAQVAQTGMVARLAGSFPLLTGVIRLAGSALSGLWALLLANPITAIVVAVGALVAAFFTWGNEIKVTADGVVGLKDAVIAAFQLMWEAISPFFSTAWEYIVKGLDYARDAIVAGAAIMGDAILSAAEAMIDAFTFVPRVVIGVVNGIIAAFQALPGQAAAVAQGIANVLIEGFEAFANGAIAAINKVIGALNALLAFVGADKAAEFFGIKGQITELSEVTLPRFKGAAANAGKAAGDAFVNGFNEIYEGGKVANVIDGLANALAPVGQKIIDRARENIANQPAPGQLGPLAGGTGTGTGSGGGGGGGGKNEKSFAQEIAELQKKIELEKQYGLQKEITNNILSIEKSIKRELTDAEKEQVATQTALLEIAKIQGETLQDILGPQEQLKLGQIALNQLFEQGAISLGQYNDKLRELQINADKASGTIGGGFRAAIAGSIQSASQFGEALGGVLVDAAGKAADAIVEFAKTGRLNIRQFFADLFAQLLKLAAQRLLLSFLGGFLGIPGAGLGGAGGGLHFATGGSILPTGPGSTDSQLVAFAKRPDERVDILTPGQQQAQKDGQGNGGGTTVVQSPPVNVAAVLSPDDIIGVFNNGGDTQIINILQRNASTVRQIAGSR